MPGLVIRLWVLFLANVIQASSWSSEACFSAKIPVLLVQCGAESNVARADDRDGDSRERSEGDRDVPEDRTEELAAVDDWSGNDVLAADAPSWGNPPASDAGYAWMEGLAPGRPPTDAPFKPPRA